MSRRPGLRDRLRPAEAGRLVNETRRLALLFGPVSTVAVSPDPDDDFLLAVAETASADYLVTGDKAGLLALGQHGPTRVVTAQALAEMLEK